MVPLYSIVNVQEVLRQVILFLQLVVALTPGFVYAGPGTAAGQALVAPVLLVPPPWDVWG